MNKIFMDPKGLKNAIPNDFWNMYIIDTRSMKAELRENSEIILPIVLSKDGIALDGYIKIQAAIELGIKEVPVVESNLETTKANRALLNQHRVKTWMDKRTDYLVSFETFGKQQGKKHGDGYNRYAEIFDRVQGKFKDPETLKVVEWILTNDEVSMVMAWWLLEKGATVSSVKKILELRNEGKYVSFTKQVFEHKLSPAAALKQIKVLEAGELLSMKAFKLPENNSESILIHDGEPEEVLLGLEKNSIKALFYEPDRYVNASGNVKVYCMKIVTDVKPYLGNRFSNLGAFFLTVKDAYKNGISLKLPSTVIDIIEKETGLIYKQTIFNSSNDSLIDKKVGNQLPDTVSQILWFVRYDKNRINDNLFNVIPQFDVDDASPLIYKQCSNHINNQLLSDMIVNINDKNIVANASALIPLYLSTIEDDLVVDLSMKGDVAPAAAIMNRKFIGVSPNRKLYENSSKAVSTVIKSYKAEMTKRLFGTPYEKVPSKKVGTRLSSKTIKK